MNNEPNGLNINTDCGSTHIEHLQKFVTDEKCDLGFAYDGDADRCIALIRTAAWWTETASCISAANT